MLMKLQVILSVNPKKDFLSKSGCNLFLSLPSSMGNSVLSWEGLEVVVSQLEVKKGFPWSTHLLGEGRGLEKLQEANVKKMLTPMVNTQML